MPNADYGVLSPAWAGSQTAALTSDHAFIQALLDVERAWCAVLADAGLIPGEHLAPIDAAADADHYDLEAIAAAGVGGGNPLIPLLGAYRAKVAETDPAAASSIHIGATSQDIMDSAMMLLISRAGAQTLATATIHHAHSEPSHAGSCAHHSRPGTPMRPSPPQTSDRNPRTVAGRTAGAARAFAATDHRPIRGSIATSTGVHANWATSGTRRALMSTDGTMDRCRLRRR